MHAYRSVLSVVMLSVVVLSVVVLSVVVLSVVVLLVTGRSVTGRSVTGRSVVLLLFIGLKLVCNIFTSECVDEVSLFVIGDGGGTTSCIVGGGDGVEGKDSDVSGSGP